MARGARPYAGEVENIREEIKGHQKELSGMDREVAGHQRTVAHAQVRGQYLRDLIQAKERMIARYTELAVARPGPRRGRRPARPVKAARPVRRARRGRVSRVPTLATVKVTSDRFAALSVASAAELVLKRAGKPVHLREITSRLIAGGKAFRAKNPEASLLTAINRDKRFRNAGKNMWRLA